MPFDSLKKRGLGGKGQTQFLKAGGDNLPPSIDHHFSPLSQFFLHKYDQPEKGQAGRALTLGQRDTLMLCFAVFFGFFVGRVGYFVPPSLSSSDSSISKC